MLGMNKWEWGDPSVRRGMNEQIGGEILLSVYQESHFNTTRMDLFQNIEISRSEEFHFGDSLMGWDTR